MHSNSVVSSHPKSVPSPLRNGGDTRNRQGGDDENDIPTEQAFDILLNIVSQSQGRFNSIQDINSAEVMFETPSEKGETTRSQRADDNRFSSSEFRQDARLDRTSLDSRKLGTELKSQDSQVAKPSSSDTNSSNFAQRMLNSQSRISAERFSSTIERSHQSGRVNGHGAAFSNKNSSISQPLQSELTHNEAQSVTAASSIAKTAVASQSPSSNAAQQVAKILATGPSQNSTTNRTAVGQGPPSLPLEKANTSHAKSTATNRPANYQDTARTVNTRRPGAAAFEQLVQSIRLRSMGGRSSATLQLNPPELGRIVVNVEMNGGDVHVDVHTENSQAKDLISSRVDSLREALQGVGVQVDQIQVEADVDAMLDQPMDYQNARTRDDNRATTDRGSAQSRKAGRVSNVVKSNVSDPLPELRRVAKIAGRIDVKI